MTKGSEKLAAWWASDKWRRILLVLGIAGILLLALPELLPRREKAADTTSAVSLTADQVEVALERRIVTLVEDVAGVGRCQVMVTLERSAQQVYAAHTVTGDSTTEETLLTVDTDGGPVGLPVTTLQPAVKGVAVVCEGGGDEAVCRQVTDLVSTVFHISDRRVCVAKLK